MLQNHIWDVEAIWSRFSELHSTSNYIEDNSKNFKANNLDLEQEPEFRNDLGFQVTSTYRHLKHNFETFRSIRGFRNPTSYFFLNGFNWQAFMFLLSFHCRIFGTSLRNLTCFRFIQLIMGLYLEKCVTHFVLCTKVSSFVRWTATKQFIVLQV